MGGLAAAGDEFPVGGVADVAVGVDDGEGGDQDAFVAEGDGERTDAALHGASHAGEFADRGAGTGADASFDDGGVGGGGGGDLTHFAGGADGGASDAEIEEDHGRDDGDAGRAEDEADAFFLQVFSDAAGGFQAKSRAAGEGDGVDVRGDVEGAEDVQFLGAGGGAADVDTGHGAGFA